MIWGKTFSLFTSPFLYLHFPGGSDSKESSCNAGDPGSIPGLGRAPGEGNGNPLQYSCLENPMDRGAWRATVHGVTKSQTRLTEHTSEKEGPTSDVGDPELTKNTRNDYAYPEFTIAETKTRLSSVLHVYTTILKIEELP